MRQEYLDKLESGKLLSYHNIDDALEKEESQIKFLLQKRPFDELAGSDLSEIQRKIDEKEIERAKLIRLKEFYLSYRGSSFERFRFRHLRTFMEVFAPIAIGIYTIILLFFFTPTPKIINAPEGISKAPTVETLQKDQLSNQSPNLKNPPKDETGK